VLRDLTHSHFTNKHTLSPPLFCSPSLSLPLFFSLSLPHTHLFSPTPMDTDRGLRHCARCAICHIAISQTNTLSPPPFLFFAFSLFFSFSLSLFPTHTHVFSLSHTHVYKSRHCARCTISHSNFTNTHTHPFPLSFPISRSLSFSLALSLAHTRVFSLSSHIRILIEAQCALHKLSHSNFTNTHSPPSFTNTHFPALSLFLFLFRFLVFSLSLSHTHICSLSHTHVYRSRHSACCAICHIALSQTNTLSPPPSLFFFRSPILFRSPSLSYTHTCVLSLSHTYTAQSAVRAAQSAT